MGAPDYFPNYPDGPCYAIGSDIIQWIDRHSSSLPLFRLEDSAMGVWISEANNLAYRPMQGEGYMYARNCPPGMWYSFINPVTADEMSVIYNHYTSTQHNDICDNGFALAVCDDAQKGCLCSPTLPGMVGCWDKQFMY